MEAGCGLTRLSGFCVANSPREREDRAVSGGALQLKLTEGDDNAQEPRLLKLFENEGDVRRLPRAQTPRRRLDEKMPEENYSFRPTDAVRTCGQVLGHVADAQYVLCSIALGCKNCAPKIEQNKTRKLISSPHSETPSPAATRPTTA